MLVRIAAALLGCVLLSRIDAWQAAVSMSRPGQEDLSFWVNHNGLLQFDVEGEVGFGDMARVLDLATMAAELERMVIAVTVSA